MSKFTSVMESHLKMTDLLRIRIKYDPASEENTSPDYVGYVLQEDGVGNVIAIVPGIGGDPMELGPEQYETCGAADNNTLTSFKDYIIRYMIERGFHEKVKEVAKTIISAKSSKELEAVVHKCGCNTEGAMLDIYRGFVDNG